jgi:signal transduction histidine kinase
MKKVVLYLFFLFLGSIGFGQANSKLDSLKRVLAKLPKEGRSFGGDTLRVNFYLHKSDLLFFKNIDSVKLLTDKALQLSRKINWKQGEARSLSKIGMWAAGGNELFQAVDYFYKALLIFEELGDINGIASTKRSLGDCYSLLGNFTKAITFNNESLQILKESKNQREYAIGLNNLALAYHDAGQYKNAIQTFQNGIYLAQNSKLNVSPIYFKINLAISLLKNKEIDKSMAIAMELLKLPIDEYNKSILYSTLADCYYEKGKFEKSKIFIKLSEKEIQKIGGNKDLELVLSEIGNKVFSALKEPVEEVKYLRKFHALSALKTKQDEEKRIRNLQFEYENENQKKEIGSLKTNRIYLIFILSIIAIAGSILMIVNQKLKKQKVLIEKQKLDLDEANNLLEAKVNQRTAELSSANAELIKKNFEITEALFKGQTIERKRVAAELHDNLGSTLSALKWRLGALNAEALSPKEKEIYESIKSMMGTAYEEVRHISHNLLPIEFEQFGLIGAVEKLTNEINLNGSLYIKFIKIGSFDNLNKKLALELYSITLELINNILKHSKATKGQVELQAYVDQITLRICDNGVGLKDDDEYGYGMQNINIRIKNLGGTLKISKSFDWTLILEIRAFNHEI